MKADATSLTFLANEDSVKVPFFQRRYVWKEDNWADLLDDMLDVKRKQFLGSIILKQQERKIGESNEVLVIDGQQRLTTLSILLKAIFDSFAEEKRKNAEELINSHLFYKRSIMDDRRYVKISHSKLDAVNFKDVIESRLTAEIVSKIDSKSSNILRCYKYFKERLEQIPESAQIGLFQRLLDKNNKFLVLIDLDEKEDEQAIFDTINSAGVRLSGADIVKNALFQKAAELMPEDEMLELYKISWDGVFAKDDDAIEYWDTPKRTGRLMRDNIEILLHAIAVAKGFFDPESHTLSELATLYKSRITKLDRSSLVKFITEIGEYAQLYRENFLSFDKTSLFSFSDDRQRLFHVLEVCEVSTFHPYVLFLLYKYSADEELLCKKLRVLERLVMRRMLSRKETKSYNKLCLEFIANDELPQSKLGEVSDDDMLEGVNEIGNKNAALLLFWIELRRRNLDNRQGLKELKYSYSLEHLMPQKWEAHWISVPVRNGLGEIVHDPAHAKLERSEKIYSIGNMTLLTGSLNSSLKNHNFLKKLTGDGKKKGIKSYDDLSITKHDITEKFDGVDTLWDEVAINQRTKALGKELLQIW